MDKKTLYLSILGLGIVLIGSIVACFMKFPAGLLIIIPVGIPHLINIYRWIREALKISKKE